MTSKRAFADAEVLPCDLTAEREVKVQVQESERRARGRQHVGIDGDQPLEVCAAITGAPSAPNGCV
jgi:hypothetical protein